MTTATHRVTLTYQYGGTTNHDVHDADDGLRRLATINPTAVRGHAVILDRERHAGSTLVALGWTAEFQDPAACTHPRLSVDSNHADMDYRAACPCCGDAWNWDDPDIPDDVRTRAMPVWEQHGL